MGADTIRTRLLIANTSRWLDGTWQSGITRQDIHRGVAALAQATW